MENKLKSQINGSTRSEISHVDLKMQENKTKLNLKKLFKNIDQEKKGLI